MPAVQAAAEEDSVKAAAAVATQSLGQPGRDRAGKAILVVKRV